MVPGGVRFVDDAVTHVVLEADTTDDDQRILQAAINAGPVHEFTRLVPDLNELFKEVVK